MAVNDDANSTSDTIDDKTDKLQRGDAKYHRNYIFPQILSDFDYEYGKSKSNISSQVNLKDTISQPANTIANNSSAPPADLENGQKKDITALPVLLNYQKKSNLRPASFARQYYLLLQRNLLCARRNYVGKTTT